MRGTSTLAGAIAACITMALAAAPHAYAQAPRPELHQQLLKTALENLGRARCGSAPCAPATDAERTSPPLTDEQARAIVAAGSVSVMAEHCGLDWQRRNFVPLMRHHREKLKLSERQIALVGLLHGITMGTLEGTVKRQPCSPEMKLATEKRLIGQ